MDELIGKRLGQYEITDHIADGGMAAVYRAYQPSMKRHVAIKVLPGRFTRDQAFVERFNIEVHAIAQLQHPHILPVHDYGTHEGSPYIVMAYLGGGSLADILSGEPCSIEDTLGICGQIAAALDFAHSKGIVHRDLKPGNVLLDEQNYAYLADFGLAKILESETSITALNILGTPAYMAPEQAKGDDISGQADVYALGVTCYEMLTGVVPFTGPSSTSVIIAHLQQSIPEIHDRRPDLPDGVQFVLERVLAKDPDERYATAGEFVTDLKSVLGGATSDSADGAKQSMGPQPALLMTNMIGHVIFVDNACLNLLRRHQYEVRTIMGQPLHAVCGVDESVTQALMDGIRETGYIEDLDLVIQDSRGESVQVTCVGLATRDDRDEFIGADITLFPLPKDPNRPPSSGFATEQPQINTQETSYLQTYFTSQLEALYALCGNWGGKRVADRFEKIINETGQRNVWPISMERGKVSVELKKTDVDIYRALLARGLGYAVHILGTRQVVKEMEYVNSQTSPQVLSFVQTLGLDTLYRDILD